MSNRSRKKRDPQKTSTSGKNDAMSDLDQFRLLMEQRDEATNRLVQVQTESAKNLAEVAGALSQVHGTQQDAHDVLGAVEKLVVDHDNTLTRHIEAVKQRNKEIDKEQIRFEDLLNSGCTGCQTLQKETTDAIIKGLGEMTTAYNKGLGEVKEAFNANTEAIHEQTKATTKLTEKQVGLGKTLAAIISIAAASVTLFAAVLMILKFLSTGQAE